MLYRKDICARDFDCFGQVCEMRREFICHRCGTPNRRGSENCSYCGLQIGWRPSFPEWLMIWRWPARIMESMGSLAPPIAIGVELALPDAAPSHFLTLPLLALSATLLVCHSITQPPGGRNHQ